MFLYSEIFNEIEQMQEIQENTLQCFDSNDPMNNTGSELLNGFDEPSTSTSLSQ